MNAFKLIETLNNLVIYLAENFPWLAKFLSRLIILEREENEWRSQFHSPRFKLWMAKKWESIS